VSVAAAALILMAFGMHPLLAIAAALGGLTALAVAGHAASRRWRPDGELTAMLADATETFGAFVVIAAVIALCFWLALKLNLRADLSVIFGVILAFPICFAFLKWVLPLVPGFRPATKRRRAG
jgi:hypothetical protein